MLSSSVRGLGLTWYVLEPLHLFRGMCKLETRLAARASLLNGIKLNLEVLEFDAEVGKSGIEVMIAVYLVGESPVIIDDEGIV